MEVAEPFCADGCAISTVREGESFYEQFDEVDDILAKLTTKLLKFTSSKEESERALQEATELLHKLEDIRSELEAILDI